MNTRFSRVNLLLGKDAMDKLKKSTVTVAGLGAVGSYAVEGLARAGIGKLRIIDFDIVRTSNINRQLYALDSTVGKPKTDVSCERIHDINPDCLVEPLNLFIDAGTIPLLELNENTILIDAIDSVGPKIELLAAAVKAGTYVISSMGAATRTNPALVRTGDISATSICPLARIIRKNLAKRGIKSGVQCVYSVEPPAQMNPAQQEENEDEFLQRGRTRRPLGSLSCLTGIFGLYAASEAIKLIIGGHHP